MKKLKILALSYDFRPKLGGVATFASEILLALHESQQAEITLITAAAAVSPTNKAPQEVDADCLPFPVTRVRVPQSAYRAIPMFARRISKEVLRDRPDLILCFLWMPDGVAAYLNQIGSRFGSGKIPYFVVAHGVEILESGFNLRKKIRRSFSLIKKAVLRNAEQVFAVSRFTAEKLKSECDMNPSQIAILHGGGECSGFFSGEKDGD